jgi:hypothetical protein
LSEAVIDHPFLIGLDFMSTRPNLLEQAVNCDDGDPAAKITEAKQHAERLILRDRIDAARNNPTN